MNRTNGPRHADEGAIVCALIVATGTSLLSGDATAIDGLPAWSGAAICVGALLGMLLVCRRAGALRMRFLLLFVAVLVAVALYGWLPASRG